MEKENRVRAVLKKSNYGMSITDISKKIALSRSSIISALAKLEGAKEVSFRKVGMAKIYSLRGRKIRGKKRLFLSCFVLLGLLLILHTVPQVHAQEISAEGITTITEDIDGEFVVDSIKKIYEVSSSRLGKGYSATLNEKDAFRIALLRRNYYIIAWNITDENVIVVFPGDRMLSFGVDDLILVDMDQDNVLDIELELMSIEDYYGDSQFVASIENEGGVVAISETQQVVGKQAEFFIKEFVASELIPSGDYFELFDVTVRLVKERIYTSRELGVFVIFENFGEGTSIIDIVYSIIDENGEEVYRGVDTKVVQTEERVSKNFDFLELPLGEYVLRTEIYYGDNQTGESEQDFEIVEVPLTLLLAQPLIFILIIVALFLVVLFTRRFYKK